MNGLPVWQLLTVFSVPTFTVLLGILPGQRSSDRLADRLDRRMERIEDEQRAMRKLMTEQYVGLLGMVGDHGQRLVRLEGRSQR